MNTSGEAADQVVRMSLEAGEAALKISGAGAKQLAVLLYAVLKEQKKTKGRTRLENLVRSGKPLTVFSVKQDDLKKFAQEAKRYGILYCAIRDPKGSKDGMVDIMVKEEDASRINRIVERFKFASVTEAAQIKTEIQRTKSEKSHEKENASTPKKKETDKSQMPQEKGRPDKSQGDKSVDELLGAPLKKEEVQTKNPSMAKTGKSHRSEPISGKQNRTAEGTSKSYQPVKSSVREELKGIREARKNEAKDVKRDTVSREGNTTTQKAQQHKQPQIKKRQRGVR